MTWSPAAREAAAATRKANAKGKTPHDLAHARAAAGNLHGNDKAHAQHTTERNPHGAPMLGHAGVHGEFQRRSEAANAKSAKAATPGAHLAAASMHHAAAHAARAEGRHAEAATHDSQAAHHEHNAPERAVHGSRPLAIAQQEHTGSGLHAAIASEAAKAATARASGRGTHDRLQFAAHNDAAAEAHGIAAKAHERAGNAEAAQAHRAAMERHDDTSRRAIAREREDTGVSRQEAESRVAAHRAHL